MLDFIVEFVGELLSEGIDFLVERLTKHRKNKRERKN